MAPHRVSGECLRAVGGKSRRLGTFVAGCHGVALVDPNPSCHGGKEGGKAASRAGLGPEPLLDLTSGAPPPAGPTLPPLREPVDSVRDVFPELGVAKFLATGAICKIVPRNSIFEHIG